MPFLAPLGFEADGRAVDNSNCVGIMLEALSNEKKKTGETFLEYFYRLKAIGQNGEVDEESLVSYIIQGIPDHSKNKMMLYESGDLNELKNKLRVYEKMKKAIGQSATKEKRFSIAEPSITNTSSNIAHRHNDKRCVNCGSKGPF